MEIRGLIGCLSLLPGCVPPCEAAVHCSTQPPSQPCREQPQRPRAADQLTACSLAGLPAACCCRSGDARSGECGSAAASWCCFDCNPACCTCLPAVLACPFIDSPAHHLVPSPQHPCSLPPPLQLPSPLGLARPAAGVRASERRLRSGQQSSVCNTQAAGCPAVDSQTAVPVATPVTAAARQACFLYNKLCMP